MIDIRRPLRIGIAVLVTALSPLAAIAPASATTNFAAVTFDCARQPGYDFHFPVYEDEISVTLVNCADMVLYDLDNTVNASVYGTPIVSSGSSVIQANTATSLTVTGPVELRVSDLSEYDQGWLHFDEVPVLDDPSDALLDVDTLTVPVVADELTIGDEADWGINTESLGADCEVMAGPHVYSTMELTISESGYFTLRTIDQSPHGEMMHPNNAYAPFDDSVMIVYSQFDASDVYSNIVACGDEIDGYTSSYDDFWFTDSAEHQRSSSWPTLGGEFEPGTYTVVYTGYSEMTAADWENGDDGYGIFEPSEATSTFELWGPENGGFSGEDSSEEGNQSDGGSLASTGVDPSFGLWAGLGLAATGVAITVARRRSQRA